MKVVVFEPHYNEGHQAVLRALAASIPNAVVRDMREYEPCNIAVIFGAAKDAYEPTWPKREILAQHSGRRLLMVESAFVRRGEYWQIGWGGFAGHADFRNEQAPIDRWEKLNMGVLPWRKKPKGAIVICGQLPRDTQVQHTDHVGWVQQTVNHYLSQGLRVKFRPHPRDKNPSQFGIDPELWDTSKMGSIVKSAKCFVTYNSTSAVDAVLAGVPVITCDRGSIAWDVTQHNLDDVHKLEYPNRTQWLAGLGYAQWNMDEIEEGQPWHHLTRP